MPASLSTEKLTGSRTKAGSLDQRDTCAHMAADGVHHNSPRRGGTGICARKGRTRAMTNCRLRFFFLARFLIFLVIDFM